jgi:hypothetical protein
LGQVYVETAGGYAESSRTRWRSTRPCATGCA